MDPSTLLGERLDFRYYRVSAETIVEQLGEAMELTGEELRKHPDFKPNFCGYGSPRPSPYILAFATFHILLARIQMWLLAFIAIQ